MIDFRAISYQGLKYPTSVREGASGEFVELRGTGFTDVGSVLLNGYLAPNFIVESTTRIFVEIPSQAMGEPITDARVLLLSAAYGQESAVVLSVGGGNGFVSGAARLMQLVIKVLLTTPGTNIFSPTLGGGLLQVVGTPFTGRQDVENTVRQAVADTEDQLRQIHIAAASRIPDSERLRSLEILDIRSDIDTSTLHVRLAVTAQDGNRVTTGVTL